MLKKSTVKHTQNLPISHYFSNKPVVFVGCRAPRTHDASIQFSYFVDHINTCLFTYRHSESSPIYLQQPKGVLILETKEQIYYYHL